MKKIISFLLVAIFLTVPVNAESSSGSNVEYVQKASFWNWVAGQNDFLHGIVGSTGASCPNSDDGYHHASSYERPIGAWTQESGYYKCICDLCGAKFDAYEKDLQQSYDAQVAELPTPQVDSGGSLYIKLDYIGYTFFIDNQSPRYNFSDDFSNFKVSGYSLSLNDKTVSAVLTSGNARSFSGFNAYFQGVAPIDGYYTGIVCPGITYSYKVFSETNPNPSTSTVRRNFSAVSSQYYTKGKVIKSSFLPGLTSYKLLSFSAYCAPPIYKVTPLTSIDFSTDVNYNINSRPGVMLGMYGDVNGNAFSNNSLSIVDETNNIYTNPATGQTDTITGWSYNYEDRSYTLTLGGGTTTTVTYGDENVTIKEGDTTYNIYYLVEGSGEDPDPGPGPDVPTDCDHTWTETSRTDPTCTTPGKVISTCSKCSQSKTETIPATGHSWVVDRTVQTTYDEEGNLLQQGYTIYKCSVCGEQYKDMEGAGPPGEDNEKSIWEKLGDLIGSGFGGIIEIIEAILGKLLDALTSLIDMIMDKFKGIVESILSIFDELPALFGGFLDFLAAIFPFLPPEITTILTFGVIAITFIGILKAVRR